MRARNPRILRAPSALWPIARRVTWERTGGDVRRRVKAIAPDLAPDAVTAYAEISHLVLPRRRDDTSVPSPSAADPARNRHRTSSGGAWGQSAVRAILKNPRYTGYEVWARQRKDEVLLDIDDVAAGHVTKQRWNPEEAWQWSREPAHPALVSRDDWEAAQNVFTAGERRSKPQRHRKHYYMLKGMVTCNDCGRKLVANTVRGTLIYQCRMKAEYPGLEHPKSLSVREDQLLPTIDDWLGQLFDPDHLDDTICSMANVETDQLDAAEELAARRVIKDCDKRIANFEIALGVTEDPDTIAGFARQIERTRAERKNAELRLRRLTTGKGLTEEEIRQVVQSLADAVKLLAGASAEDRRRVYEAAQLEVLYDHHAETERNSTHPRIRRCGVRVRVGGAITTLNPRRRSRWLELVAAA